MEYDSNEFIKNATNVQYNDIFYQKDTDTLENLWYLIN